MTSNLHISTGTDTYPPELPNGFCISDQVKLFMMTIPIRASILLGRNVQTSALCQSMTSIPTTKVPTTVPTGRTTELAEHRQPVQKAACAVSSRLSVKCREPPLHLPASKTSRWVYAECVSRNKGQREQQRNAASSWRQTASEAEG